MQHGSLISQSGLVERHDRYGCCKPYCGYILEEIHSHRQECCCFDGLLDICGLPCHLCAPLTLCGVKVVCIAPQCAQNRLMFRLTLCCEVADCRGYRACGEACMTVALCHAPVCPGENLRLGAQVDVKEARFCAPSAFQVCADVQLIVVTSGAGRILKAQTCASDCVFPPLYPAPAHGKRERGRMISACEYLQNA